MADTTTIKRKISALKIKKSFGRFSPKDKQKLASLEAKLRLEEFKESIRRNRN